MKKMKRAGLRMGLLILYLALLLGVSGPATIGSAHPQPPTIALPQGADLVIYGPEDARIGHSLLAGDLSGDGIDDILIGEPQGRGRRGKDALRPSGSTWSSGGGSED
jgi:hypothetical protein